MSSTGTEASESTSSALEDGGCPAFEELPHLNGLYQRFEEDKDELELGKQALLGLHALHKLLAESWAGDRSYEERKAVIEQECGAPKVSHHAHTAGRP